MTYIHPQDTYAFPIPTVIEADGSVFEHGQIGMTLRDWFAGQALNGLLADSVMASNGRYGTGISESDVADMAYGMANAMLHRRQTAP